MIKKLKDEVFTQKNLRRLPYYLLLFIFFKIIFTDNGLIDYVRTKKFIEQKQEEFTSLVESNKDLEKEIKKIETDEDYQKKLIREKLGAISSDEYLVLFAEESSPSSPSI